MKLLLSDTVLQEVFRFSREYGRGKPIVEDFAITVRLSTLSLKFLQAERYAKLIACHFNFTGDVGFFFEDVQAAIGRESDSQQDHMGECLPSDDVLKRNDVYVMRVLRYCEKNINLLAAIPPPWFPEAAKISDAATRKHLPDIADADLRKKQELWESWQKLSQ